MEKYTIQKTYFMTDNDLLYHLFGLDDDNKPLIITDNNIESLTNYISECIDDIDNYSHDTKQLIESELHIIKHELQTV